MKVRLNYGFSCKFEEHDIQSGKMNLNYFYSFEISTVKIYISRFLFSIRNTENTREKKGFYSMTRRVGTQDRFHSQVGIDDCMKVEGKKTEQPIAVRKEIRLWVQFN